MELYFAAAVFAVSTTITPGPNNIMMMSSGLNHGAKKSVPHFLGICIGFPLMVFVVGLGLGFIFERYSLLHQLIRVVGIIYLLYLSWKVATAAPGRKGEGASNPLTFWQAAAFQWVNPKAWIMASGAIAAYTSMTAAIFPQVAMLTLIFLLAAFPCVGVWLFFGLGLQSVLKNPAGLRAFNYGMAVLLLLSLGPVALDVVAE